MDNRTIEEVKANEAKLIEKINELENINDKLSQALSSSEQKLEQINAVADTNSELADHYKNKLNNLIKWLEDKIKTCEENISDLKSLVEVEDIDMEAKKDIRLARLIKKVYQEILDRVKGDIVVDD